MLRSPDDYPPEWLNKLFEMASELVRVYHARPRLIQAIKQWRADNPTGPTDLYGRLPDRPLSVTEKMVFVAALHDCGKSIEPLNPWPDPRDDPAQKAAIMRRGSLTYSETKWCMAAIPLYILRHGVLTSMPESDVSVAERIIRELMPELDRWCRSRGKMPFPSDVLPMPRSGDPGPPDKLTNHIGAIAEVLARVDDGIERLSEVSQSTPNGGNDGLTDTLGGYTKKRQNFKWDVEAEECANAFKHERDSGSQQSRKDFCIEYAETHGTNASGSTLAKKLSQNRDRWDSRGRYGRPKKGVADTLGDNGYS